MKRPYKAFRSAAITGLLLFTALGASAASPWGRTWSPGGVRAAYRAFIPSPEGRYPRSAGSWIEVRINNFTTEREARSIVDMYNDGDELPLRRVLGNRNIGTLQIGDRLAQPLAAAWRIRDLSGEHLVLLVPRDAAVRDLFGGQYDRSRYERGNRYDREDRDDRYDRDSCYDRDSDRGYDRNDRRGGYERPYALIQLDLGGERDRYGSGELRIADRVTLGDDGGFDFLDSGAQPVRVLHVERIQP